ncbi:MAG: glycosyltransferase family 9 protein [Candidatus Eisenbacteria bacterium]
MRRILLARLHSLGDVVLSTGIAARVAGVEGARVEILTLPAFRPLFAGLPVAAIWDPATLPRKAGSFDRVIDLQASATSRRILRGLGPPARCRSRSAARRWVVLWGDRPPRPAIPHAVVRYAEAAGMAGEPVSRLRPTVQVTEEEQAEARRRFPAAWERTARPCAALATGASRAMKRWPEDRFEAVARALEAEGWSTIRLDPPRSGAGRTLGTGQVDADGYGEEPGRVRAPLGPLKAILARCRALVSNDSGVMHLGAGLGVPVVALFGSTSPVFGFAPLGPRDRVLGRPLECRPCAAHGARFCWLGHRRCLEEIQAGEVATAAAAILRERSPR